MAQIERKRVVLRQRSPRSGRITTIVPEAIFSAIRKAPATAAPLDIPTKSPSLAASSLVVSKAWPVGITCKIDFTWGILYIRLKKIK